MNRKGKTIPYYMAIRCMIALTVLFPMVAMGESPVDFNRAVLPILAEKCFACHGPDGSKRKAGLRLDTQAGIFTELESGAIAVVQGDVEASALVARITTDDVDDIMPPADFSKSLKASEKETLKQWVAQGAEWKGHWSLTPLTKPAVPVGTSEWTRNPIDHFVLSKLNEKGLSASPAADKRTLIRRVYFDLHGLPPTPEAVDAFLVDEREDAFEQLVDNLLDSPRYGERWARHWLDVAHYADTHGYDKDKRRVNSWPYRDYVIQALNEDKPWGQFIEEQLAGDVLYPADPMATVATGFVAAGPWDFVGHVELREGTKDKKIARYLDRDDMVTSAMMSFTSMTVNCARCHDHKFDPITQADYYGLQAVFAGVERANRSYDLDPAVHEERQQLKNERFVLEAKKGDFDAVLASAKSPALTALQQQVDALKEAIKAVDSPDSPSNGYHSAIELKQDVTKWVQVDLGETQTIREIRLVPARPTDFVNTPGFGFPIRYHVDVSNDSEFNTAERVADYTALDNDQRTDHDVVFDDLNLQGRYVRVTATKLFKRLEDYIFALAELEVRGENKNVARGTTVTALDSIESGRWAKDNLVDGYSSRNRLGGDVDEQDKKQLATLRKEQMGLEREIRDLRLATLSEADQEVLETVKARLRDVMKALRKLPDANTVYAAANQFKREGNFTPANDGVRAVHLLGRGDVTQPGALMGPGAIQAINTLEGRFTLPADHDEGQRRAALAQWISDEANPLTWRSVVNRVWQYHFGRGLVDTPNDFGKMGTPPTHPELLDWLAATFLEEGESLKALHRLILTSATWRQAVAHDIDNASLDGSNRYLWRMNRRQLEAEALRDAVLAVGGKLDLTMGGPGFDAFVFEDDHSPRYLYAQYDPADESTFRRSVYRFIVRSVPDPFLTTLDCADPSQSVPVRSNTITALQALSLYNNPMVVRHASYLAERLESEVDSIQEQVALLYRYALSREAKADEVVATTSYAENHGLAAACRIVLNSNEFIFLD